MAIINNRYRIVEELERFDPSSLCLITDMAERGKEKAAYLFDEGLTAGELDEFYSGDFAVYKRLTHTHILKSYEIEKIKNIGGKRSGIPQYMLLSEHVDGFTTLLNSIGKIPRKSVLDLFISACQAVHYLHVKNVMHGSLNSLSVIITGKKRKVLHLRDIASTKLLRHIPGDSGYNTAYFQAPEARLESAGNVQTDIYSLGVVLFCLVADKGDISSDFKVDLAKFKGSDEFIEKAMFIIEKATAGVGTRYSSILQMVDDINDLFKTDYKAFRVAELEHLVLETKLVGRKSELETLVECTSNVTAQLSLKRHACISAEQGMGKTSLLRRLRNKLRLQDSTVFWSFDNNGSNAIQGLLKQLIEEGNSRHNDDMIKYIVSVINGRAVDARTGHGGTSIVKFIYDCIKDRAVVIILDNLDDADIFTLDLVDKLETVCRKLSIVFSFRRKHTNKRLTVFMDRLSGSDSLTQVRLETLTRGETAELIKNVFFIRELSDEFTDAVFNSTGGNPFLIVETLKSFKANRIIYVDENDGKWQTSLEIYDYDKIPMPTRLEQAARQQAKKLSRTDYKMLEVISLFENLQPTKKRLNAVLLVDAKKLSSRLSALVKDGILYAAEEAKTFSIVNKSFGEFLSSSIEPILARELHLRIANALLAEEVHSADVLSEIIYHLEILGEDKKLPICYENLADKNAEAGFFGNAIPFYNKALEIYRKTGNKHREIDIRLKLGDALMLDTKALQALECMEWVVRKTRDFGLVEKHVRALIKKCECYGTLFMEDKNSRLVNARIDAKFEDKGFREASMELYMDYLMARLSGTTSNASTEEFRVEAEYALSVCLEGRSDIKAIALRRLSLHYLFTGDFKKAIELARQSVDVANSTDNEKIQIECLQGLALLYVNTRNGELANSIYEELLSRNQDPKSLYGILLGKIGNDYAYHYELGRAIENIGPLKDVAALVGVNPYTQSIALFAKLFLDADLYTQAEDLILSCASFVEDDNERRATTNFLTTNHMCWYYMFIGNLQMAETTLERVRKFKQGSMLFQQMYNELASFLSVLLEVQSENPDNKDISAHIKAAAETMLFKDAFGPMDISDVFYFLIWVCRHGYFEQAVPTLKLLLAQAEKVQYISPYLEIKLLYIRSLLQNESEKRLSLNKAYKLAVSKKQYLLQALICRDLSKLEQHTNTYLALDYAVRACEAAQNILKNSPKNSREMMAKHYNLFELFEGFILLSNDASMDELIDKMTAEGVFSEMSADEGFRAGTRRRFFAELPVKIETQKDLLRNLSDNAKENLHLFAEYFSAVTCATKCFIVVDDTYHEFRAIASKDGNLNMQGGEHILKHAKILSHDILITGEYSAAAASKNMLPESVKAALCLPMQITGGVKGYIYACSDSVFHNINSKSLEECKELINPLVMNISMYLNHAKSLLDKLTEVLNRTHLDLAIESSVKRATNTGTPLSVIMLDVDKFKEVNDLFGHSTGDTVLRGIGRVLRDNVRRDNTSIGRYGGEEFMVVCDGADIKDAELVAERVRQEIEKAALLGTKRSVTASLGVATFAHGEDTVESLISKADNALYFSKANGRNKTTVYSSALDIGEKQTSPNKGIISGDIIKDAMRMRMTLEVLDITKSTMTEAEKQTVILDKIKQIAEADEAMYISMNTAPPSFAKGNGTKASLISSAVAKKKPTILTEEQENGMSMAAIPQTQAGEVSGILFLSTLAKKRKFKADDIGLLTDLGYLAYSLT
ncbi:MAG: diguanylate cyclase [Oscillospiraceae bacterium]|nr:diguanylate cyclase [Oscillospiraceae bacterium]